LAEAPPAEFAVTCRYCHQNVLTAPRLRDAELARLRQHIERHRDHYRAPPTGVAAVLEHFTVAPAR
jgi:hypothetical protein